MESNIRRLRAERHISQSRLAEELGLSQQMISRMENDRNKIQVKALIDIADYFQVSTDMVLRYTPPEEGYTQEQENRTEESYTLDNRGRRKTRKSSPGYYDDQLPDVVYEILVGIKEYLNNVNT